MRDASRPSAAPRRDRRAGATGGAAPRRAARRASAAAAALAVLLAPAALAPGRAQEAPLPAPVPHGPPMNLFGMTGLIDQPSARTQPDGQLSFTAGYFDPFLRNTLSFAAHPRLEGAFRYAVLEDFFGQTDLFDRSFDVKVRFSDETNLMPALAFGLQDFLGTGVYSAEYFVGTKRVAPGLDLTAGFGWGRFEGGLSVPNPFCELRDSFCTRDTATIDDTGTPRVGNFFRGERIGLFGGVSYRPPDLPDLVVKVEYAPDDYDRESNSPFAPELPVNLGAEYRMFDWLTLGGYWLYGTEFGLRGTIAFDPSRQYAPRDLQRPGPPLRVIPQPPAAPSPRFGPVIEALSPEPALGSAARLADVELAAAADGARWAEATLAEEEAAALAAGGSCPVDAARDIDAELGVIDGVTFRDGAGRAVCTVILRPEGRAWIADRTPPPAEDASWAADRDRVSALNAALRDALRAQGLRAERLALGPAVAELELINGAYNAAPQALGRAATALANTLPRSVRRFEITLMENDLRVVTVILRRADLEDALAHHDPARRIRRDVAIRAATTEPPTEPPTEGAPEGAAPGGVYGGVYGGGGYPRFGWSINPRLPLSLFDPDQPVRFDLSVDVAGEVRFDRGLSISGTVRKRVIGQLDDIDRQSDSTLPRVRSEFARYLAEGDPGILRLTGDWLFQPAPEVYGRLTAGLIEQQFGGVSGEVLWKPLDGPFAWGLELNYVKQRGFEQLFSFRDYEVLTGHASMYWDTGWRGYEVQVDAGRYLAGDHGATFSVTRRFPNGWEVGGFFTLTDVPFDEFGEGAFDKGLRLTVPLSWGLPYETRSRVSTIIRPLTRDGGARLDVSGRLYGAVRDLDRGGLGEDWGNFWR